MSTFSEADHPRSESGQWRAKDQAPQSADFPGAIAARCEACGGPMHASTWGCVRPKPASAVQASPTPTDDDEWDSDEDVCVVEDCGESLNDGEGFDGYCGTHADKIESHSEGYHQAAEGGPDADCPNCNGAGVVWA